MDNQYTIQRIIPEACTNEQWQAYFAFRVACDKLAGKPTPFSNWEQYKERNSALVKEGTGIYLVWNGKKEAGFFFFRKSFDLHLKKHYINFENDLLDKTLNKEVLKPIGKAYLDFDVDTNFLAITSHNGRNDFLETELGAIIGGQTETFELDVTKVDHQKMEEWVATNATKYPQYQLKLYEYLPDELIEEYASVFTELLHDMPAQSELGSATVTPEQVKTRQETSRPYNRCAYRYLLFNEAGKIIAKTNVAINKNHPQNMYQFMTGVLKDYRGLGLSKWLKGAMFLRLVKDFPSLEKIMTETHPTNAGSKEVSRQMGYQQTGTKKELLIERKQMTAFIGQ